jgi:hypothetical protein
VDQLDLLARRPRPRRARHHREQRGAAAGRRGRVRAAGRSWQGNPNGNLKISGAFAFNFTNAAVLFLTVLVTAAAPGYVTTDFYQEVQTKLAAAAHSDGGDGGGSCEELGAPPPKDTPTALSSGPRRPAAGLACTSPAFR